MNMPPVHIQGIDLRKLYRVSQGVGSSGKKRLTAVDGISIAAATGETVGIAGESGCGKSTLGRMLAGLLAPDSGTLLYRGREVTSLSREEAFEFRRSCQMVFQDPFSSLNPRMRIGDTVAEPMLIAGCTSGTQLRQKTLELLEKVGLGAEHAQRFPDEFSGGQRQRIGIARALAASPSLLVADEPVSSLDISIQAQIINLLMDMKRDFGLTLVIISHNLSVLRHMCDRIDVMYLGAVVESAPADELFTAFRHPYTEALIAAIPGLDRNTRKRRPPLLTDDLPSPFAVTAGCRFHPRCRYATDICRRQIPLLSEVAAGHLSACHYNQEKPAPHAE